MTTGERITRAEDAVVQRQLSANEKFMASMDRGDDFGVFGVRAIVMGGWRMRGPLDVTAVQRALDDVVARHEVLRTATVRDDGEPYACVHPPCQAKLTVVELSPEGDEADREHRAHVFLNEIDDRSSVDPARMPLLHATLARFDDEDAVLALVTHHTVSDGWSIHLVMRDFAHFYAKRRGLPAPELPELRQYGEYASWQEQAQETESAAVARQYWKEKLAGGYFLTIPTDRPRRYVPPVYAVYRFVYDKELVSATTSLAKSLRSSPFMVLFACFALFLHRRTGVNDIVSAIFTSGRNEPEFEQTVGPLFNMLPVRIDLSGCESFAELVHRARATLLEAYTYELPFSELAEQAEPELMAPINNMSGVVTGFETFQYPQELEAQVIGDVRYTGLTRRLISSDDTSEIPDGKLWDFALDPSGDMVGAVRFNSLEFDKATVVAMIDEHRELLRASLKSPNSALLR